MQRPMMVQFGVLTQRWRWVDRKFTASAVNEFMILACSVQAVNRVSSGNSNDCNSYQVIWRLQKFRDVGTEVRIGITVWQDGAGECLVNSKPDFVTGVGTEEDGLLRHFHLHNEYNIQHGS